MKKNTLFVQKKNIQTSMCDDVMGSHCINSCCDNDNNKNSKNKITLCIFNTIYNYMHGISEALQSAGPYYPQLQ